MFARRNLMMFSSRRMLHGMFREVQLVEDDCATERIFGKSVARMC